MLPSEVQDMIDDVSHSIADYETEPRLTYARAI